MDPCDNPIKSFLYTIGVLPKPRPLDREKCNYLSKQLECTYGENFLALSDSLCDIRELKEGVACLMKDRFDVSFQQTIKRQNKEQEISQVYKTTAENNRATKSSGEAAKKSSGSHKNTIKAENSDYVAVESSMLCKVEGPKPCKQIMIQNTSDTKIKADYDDERVDDEEKQKDIKLNFDIILETDPRTKIKQIFANVNYDDRNYNYKADLIEQVPEKLGGSTEYWNDLNVREDFEKTIPSSSLKSEIQQQQQQRESPKPATIHGESLDRNADIISKKSSSGRGTVTETVAVAASEVLDEQETLNPDANTLKESAKDSAKDSANGTYEPSEAQTNDEHNSDTNQLDGDEYNEDMTEESSKKLSEEAKE